MQIEQRIVEESIQNVLKDPKKYRKMMLILQQTLYDLGYHQSAKTLQQQSGIKFYSKQLKSLKKFLDSNDFQKAIQIIDNLILQQSQQIQIQKSALNSVKCMIYQTYCMVKIHRNEYEEAMKIINEKIENQQKKQYLCQALVLGNLKFLQKDLQKKKDEIFKFCLIEYQQIGERQIQKVIECYSLYQGNQNKELKNLTFPFKKFPPMKILSHEAQNRIKGQLTHLKINQIHDLLLGVSENKQGQNIIIFKIHRKNLKFQKQISQSGQLSLKLKYPIFMFKCQKNIDFTFKNKKQSIETICWNVSKENPLIAAASFSIIQILNINLQTIKKIECQNKIQKVLSINYNPISDLLYTAGYFEYMNVYDYTGQIILSIHPFPKVRKFIFFKKFIYSISLVSNKVYKHSIDEQILLIQKQLDQNIHPMDICISSTQQNYLAISSNLFIYILNSQTLQIIGKTSSPVNNNKLTIEINFYGQFLITLCKNFQAFEISSNNSNIKMQDSQYNSIILTKIRQWSGQGTFIITKLIDNLMISGSKQLICWQEGNFEIEDDYSQFQQEPQSIVDIDIEESQISEQNDEDSNNDNDNSEISDFIAVDSSIQEEEYIV